MSFEPHIIDKLGEPLDRNKVSQRKQSGRTLDYIEGWHAIAEANRIFGHDGWVRETVTLTETNRDLVDLTSDRGDYQQWRVGYLAKVRITAHGVVREGVGFGSGIGRPELLGDAIESAIKEAETDATKRALMTFGWPFGLALYDKSREHVEDGRKPEPKPAERPKGTIPDTFWNSADYSYRTLYQKDDAGKPPVATRVLTAMVEQAPSLDALLKVKGDNGGAWDALGDKHVDLFKTLDAAFRKRMGFFEQQNMEAA